MDTLYNWLLQNTGNEGNYYTILNPQRHTTAEGPVYVDVMARSKEFVIVNLFIYDAQLGDPASLVANPLQSREQTADYTFSQEQQVIDYLSNGKTPDAATGNSRSSIHLLVLNPTSNAGDITFPPAK